MPEEPSHLVASASDPSPMSLPTTVQQPRSSGRWWLAVAVGCLVSLPVGWLLSYGALLPNLLGLFFFILFGLLIGAVTFRVARAGRPYGRMAVIAGTILIVSTGWITSIAKESREFPEDMAKEIGSTTRDLGGLPIDRFRKEKAEAIRGFLRLHYPPGGTLGYMRWVLTSGELRSGEVHGIKRHLRRRQKTFWWATRVVLSIVCLGFGVGSQTLSLRQAGEGMVSTSS